MHDRFTDRARKALQMANQEAQRFNHEYVGTEHILLGLVKEGSGIAANVLKCLGADAKNVRQQVEKLIKCGPDMINMGKLPQTPGATKVIAHAVEVARKTGHNCVGTEHVLLGLVTDTTGVAWQVLQTLGITAEAVTREVFNLLGYGPPETAKDTPPAAVGMRTRAGTIRIRDKLVSFLYELMRDHLPPGVVENVVQNALKDVPTTYCNGWLAQYAEDIAKRICEPASAQKDAVPPGYRQMSPGELIAPNDMYWAKANGTNSCNAIWLVAREAIGKSVLPGHEDFLRKREL